MIKRKRFHEGLRETLRKPIEAWHISAIWRLSMKRLPEDYIEWAFFCSFSVLLCLRCNNLGFYFDISLFLPCLILPYTIGNKWMWKESKNENAIFQIFKWHRICISHWLITLLTNTKYKSPHPYPEEKRRKTHKETILEKCTEANLGYHLFLFLCVL